MSRIVIKHSEVSNILREHIAFLRVSREMVAVAWGLHKNTISSVINAKNGEYKWRTAITILECLNKKPKIRYVIKNKEGVYCINSYSQISEVLQNYLSNEGKSIKGFAKELDYHYHTIYGIINCKKTIHPQTVCDVFVKIGFDTHYRYSILSKN